MDYLYVSVSQVVSLLLFSFLLSPMLTDLDDAYDRIILQFYKDYLNQLLWVMSFSINSIIFQDGFSIEH